MSSPARWPDTARGVIINQYRFLIGPDGNKWIAISKDVKGWQQSADTEAELLEKCQQQVDEWGDISKW